jgi:hypothetical protein
VFRSTYRLRQIYYCPMHFSELTLWSLNDGKILKRVDLADEAGDQRADLIKLKVKASLNLLIALMKNSVLLLYNCQLEPITQLMLFSGGSQQLDSLIILDNANNFDSASDINTLRLYETRKRKCFSLLLRGSIDREVSDISVTANNEFDLSLEETECLIVWLEGLEIVLLIDKQLKRYRTLKKSKNNKNKPNSTSSSSSSIRYNSNDDEKQVAKFYRLFGAATFKFKLLSVNERPTTGAQVTIAISALVPNEDTIHSSVVLCGELIKSIKRRTLYGDDTEFVINRAFSFCKCYMHSVNALCFHRVVEVNERMALDKNELALAKARDDSRRCGSLLALYDLVTNKKRFELDLTAYATTLSISHVCIDAKLSYVLHFDEASKLLYMHRVSDSAQLACLPLYGSVLQMKFNSSDSMLCISMSDRRIFTLLLLDPQNKIHWHNLEQLPSRQRRSADADDVSQLEQDSFNMLNESDVSSNDMRLGNDSPSPVSSRSNFSSSSGEEKAKSMKKVSIQTKKFSIGYGRKGKIKCID